MKTINPGDVISYIKMCSIGGVNLQRGMNFRLKKASLRLLQKTFKYFVPEIIFKREIT